MQKCYSDFELQGVPEHVLNSKTHQSINSRLQVTCFTVFIGPINKKHIYLHTYCFFYSGMKFFHSFYQ